MKIQEPDVKRKKNATSKMPPGKATLSVSVDLKVSDDLMQIANNEEVNKSDLMRHIFESFIKNYNEEK